MSQEKQNSDAGLFVATGLYRILTIVVGTIAAMGVVSMAIWYVVEPRLEDWVDERFEPIEQTFDTRIRAFDEQMARMAGLFARLEGRILSFPNPPILEFSGGPIIINQQKEYRPGDYVRIMYLLRRNASCDTTITARFASITTGAMDSSMTYEFKASRATVSSEFVLFVARIRIPMEAHEDTYTYVPVARVTDAAPECASFAEVYVPPSPPFRVVEDG